MILNLKKFRRPFILAATLGAAATLISAAPDATQQIQQLLNGPPKSGSTLPPFTSTPAPTTVPTIVKVSSPRTTLPLADPITQPRMVPSDKKHAIVTRSPVDLPPLADASLMKMTPPPLPIAPLASAVGANPANVLPTPTAVQPSSILPPTDPAGDPTLELTKARLLAVTPPLRQTAAPFIKLTIPTPEDTANAAPSKAYPDSDPPAKSLIMPPKPRLPETKSDPKAK